MSITRFRITQTPSNTATNTPTNTASHTPCPTFTSTPTNTATPTNTISPTPSPTYCYEPKAIVLFDGNSGRTSLNAWMLSQGSTFRGLNLNSPSGVQSTFQAQMNSYINYTGFGTTTYSIIQSAITYNQDPIVLTNNVNNWTGDQTWVSYFVPTCIHCPGSYTLMGEATPSYVVNTLWTGLPFYYSGTVIPQGQYIFYSTKPGSGVNFSNSSSEYSLGGLVCSGITPTPTITSTQTATPTLTSTPTNTGTPTMTPTPFEVCPTQMTINKITGAWIYPNQTYNRITSYTGGTFSGGYVYFNGATTNFIPGATSGGTLYSTYGIESGGTYYNLVAYTSTLVNYNWIMFATTGDYYISKGTNVSNNLLNTNAVLNSTTIGGITYPKPGIQNTGWSNVIYPSICPTLTPTATPTITPTQTSTPTITSTQTNTPSITATQTQTATPTSTSPVITPTNTATNTETPTNTATQTQTQTPSQTNTPSITATNTETPTPSITASQTQTQTNTGTPTSTPTNTSTPTGTPEITPSMTQTNTSTATPTSTSTCSNYNIEGAPSIDAEWIECDGTPNSGTITTAIVVCAQTGSVYQTGGAGNIIQLGACFSITPTPSMTQTSTPPITPTNTPTNTATMTNTPTNTATNTSTPTNTPTGTPPVEECSFVVVNTQPSLDIPIYDVYVNGVQVVYSSGGNWTITPSNSPGTFTTSQTGNTQTVAVYYSSNIAGQRIEILDCDEITQCQNINPGGGIATFTNVVVNCGCYWSINGYDGTC